MNKRVLVFNGFLNNYRLVFENLDSKWEAYIQRFIRLKKRNKDTFQVDFLLTVPQPASRCFSIPFA